MDTTHRTRALAEAIEKRDAARARFEAAPRGSREWGSASDDLDFWIGKVAALSLYFPQEA